jgi:hypothetical protein
MRNGTVAASPWADIDPESWAVHAWRVNQLTRLGLAQPAAEEVADKVDWHEVARWYSVDVPPRWPCRLFSSREGLPHGGSGVSRRTTTCACACVAVIIALNVLIVIHEA